MNKSYGIQLTDLKPGFSKTQSGDADFISSVPGGGVIVDEGDEIIVKSCFINNTRGNNSGNIVIEDDIELSIKFNHYYIPTLTDGIDTGTSSSAQYNGSDANISNQGLPFVLMVRKDYYNEYMQNCINQCSIDNPPRALPFQLFDADKLYTPENYNQPGGWTWDNFVPAEFEFLVNLPGNTTYTPSYLAQYITQQINSQTNGTLNQNWQNQVPLFPPGGTPINSVFYNPDYANNLEWGPGQSGFAFEWFGGPRSNNPFNSTAVVDLMNIEFYNAWYNDNQGNRKTYVFLWKCLYDNTWLHPSSYMMSGSTQAFLDFDTNNSGLFSFNLHSPIYNNNQISIQYRGYSEKWGDEPADINYGWLFTKQGGCILTDLQPQSFWNQLGFDSSILVKYDNTNPNTLYQIPSTNFKKLTSDTYTTISMINANQNYILSQKPIYGAEPSADNYNLFFAASDFVEIYAKSPYISNLNDYGHLLLELSAYKSEMLTETTFSGVKAILPLYYNTPGQDVCYINQISSYPSVYLHVGDSFLLGYMRCRILKADLSVAKLNKGNWIYLEVIKNNIGKSIKIPDTEKAKNDETETRERQTTLYAGTK
jgi:hypothetical protein